MAQLKTSLTKINAKASTVVKQISQYLRSNEKYQKPFNNRKEEVGRTSAIFMVRVRLNRN